MPKKVLVCQNVTCQEQGSKKVLAALLAQAPADVVVEPAGCLGQCGNGPMMLTLPDKVWYHRVRPGDIPRIVEQHLKGDRPVESKRYSTAPDPQNSILLWVVGLGIFLSLCVLLAVVAGANAH